MAQDSKLTAIREPLTKAQLFAAISEETGLAKKDVASVFESLTHHMHRHLKKRAAGVFTLPGLAKFTVATKKATKARKGVNPFTGEEIMIAAKPARRVIKVRALKGLKEMAES
jgi:nucleoid DNA-binding protein